MLGKGQRQAVCGAAGLAHRQGQKPNLISEYTWSGSFRELSSFGFVSNFGLGAYDLFLRFKPEYIVSGHRSMKPLEHQFASRFGLDQFFNTTQEPLRN